MIRFVNDQQTVTRNITMMPTKLATAKVPHREVLVSDSLVVEDFGYICRKAAISATEYAVFCSIPFLGGSVHTFVFTHGLRTDPGFDLYFTYDEISDKRMAC